MHKGLYVRGEGLLQVLEKGRLFLDTWLVTAPVDRGWGIPCKCQGEATKE